MASLVEIILSAQDRTGPAFQSASTSLRVYGQTNDQTTARITTLSERLTIQQRQLALYERQVRETTAAQGADSIAAQRLSITYDRLAVSIRASERELDRLHDEQRQGVGIVVPGAGIAAGAGASSVALGGLTTAFAGATRAAGAFAAVYAGNEARQFIGDSLALANAYTTVETTLKSLTGSQELYNETVAIAQRNQSLLGGSMDDQLRSMSALIPLVRTTNAELATLTTTQQLLALRTPTEGMGGAAFSLQEFLTSTTAEGVRSLAERFNLPRQQLQAIMQQNQGDQQAQLVAIQDLLAQQGITMQTLEDQARSAAGPFRDLSVAWSNFKLREGQAAQRLLGPGAQMLAGGLNLITNSPSFADMLGMRNAAAPAQPSARAALAPVIGPTAQPTARAALAPMVGPGTLPSARIAAPQQTAPAQPAPINQVNVTVHGSVVTETQLTDAIHRGLLTKQSQSGSLGFKR